MNARSSLRSRGSSRRGGQTLDSMKARCDGESRMRPLRLIRGRPQAEEAKDEEHTHGRPLAQAAAWKSKTHGRPMAHAGICRCDAKGR